MLTNIITINMIIYNILNLILKIDKMVISWGEGRQQWVIPKIILIRQASTLWLLIFALIPHYHYLYPATRISSPTNQVAHILNRKSTSLWHRLVRKFLKYLLINSLAFFIITSSPQSCSQTNSLLSCRSYKQYNKIFKIRRTFAKLKGGRLINWRSIHYLMARMDSLVDKKKFAIKKRGGLGLLLERLWLEQTERTCLGNNVICLKNVVIYLI